MSDHRPPSFDDIVEPDDPDRARLLAAHDLLAAAGAPPELPPSLEEAPEQASGGSVINFPQQPRQAGADDRDEGARRRDRIGRPPSRRRGR
jgi:hypothetical protein